MILFKIQLFKLSLNKPKKMNLCQKMYSNLLEFHNRYSFQQPKKFIQMLNETRVCDEEHDLTHLRSLHQIDTLNENEMVQNIYHHYSTTNEELKKAMKWSTKIDFIISQMKKSYGY